MNSEFPYQLVAFLDKQPRIGEPVYAGKNGWYPQIALKRRFRTEGADEDELKDKIKQFCAALPSITVRTGRLVSVDSMPVKIIEVLNQDELTAFHRRFIDLLGNQIVSKFPDREYENYLPHITAEYGGQMVIDTDRYIDSKFTVSHACLLKDADGGDSLADQYFDLLV